MKLKIDESTDALYLTLDEAPAAESEEVAPGVILDYREDGTVVGIEMLYISKRLPGADLHRFMFETTGKAIADNLMWTLNLYTELKYPLVIEVTDDPNFFGFYSPDLKGFTGVEHTVKDCLYQACWGMDEHTGVIKNLGLEVPQTEGEPMDLITHTT